MNTSAENLSTDIADFWVSGKYRLHIESQIKIAIFTPILYLLNGDKLLLDLLMRYFGFTSECVLGLYLINALVMVQFFICFYFSLKVMRPFKSTPETWGALKEYVLKAEVVKALFSSKKVIRRNKLVSYCFLLMLYMFMPLIVFEKVASFKNLCDVNGDGFIFDFSWFCYVVFLSLLPAISVFIFKLVLLKK